MPGCSGLGHPCLQLPVNSAIVIIKMVTSERCISNQSRVAIRWRIKLIPNHIFTTEHCISMGWHSPQISDDSLTPFNPIHSIQVWWPGELLLTGWILWSLHSSVDSSLADVPLGEGPPINHLNGFPSLKSKVPEQIGQANNH